jgi:hypothetical protein
MFIPETLRKKTENKMKKILDDLVDTRCKMQLITDGGKITDADSSVTVLKNNLKEPIGMILTINK